MQPVAIRTNNPGAMWPNPIASQFGSTGYENLADGNKAAIFPDPVHGAAAQFALWSKKYAGMPLSSAIAKWSGNNSSPQYADFIRNNTGLDLSTPLTPEVLSGPQGLALAKAQSRWEAGRDIGMSDDDWQKAQALAFNGTDPGPIAKSGGQSAISNALASGDSASIPAKAKPVMFQGGQEQPSDGLLSILKGNDVPDTGLGRMLGLGNVGSAIGAIGRGLVTAANPAAGAALQSAHFNQMLAMSPDLKQVSTDMFGHPVMAWVRKMGANGQPSITPVNGTVQGGAGAAGSGVAGGTMGGSTIDENTIRQLQQMQGSPEDKLTWLQKQNASAASVVGGLIKGNENIGGLPRSGEGRTGWMALANAIDPNFNGDASYAARTAEAKNLATSNNPATLGGAIASLGKVSLHGKELLQASDELAKLQAGGGNLTPLNAAENFIKKNSTDSDYKTKLNSLTGAVDLFSREADRLVSGGRPTLTGQDAMRQLFDPNKSHEERAAAVRRVLSMAQDATDQLVFNNNRAFGRTGDKEKKIEDFMSPATLKAWQAVQQSGSPSPQPQSQSKPPMDGANQAPDGHWYVQQNGKYFRVDQ